MTLDLSSYRDAGPAYAGNAGLATAEPPAAPLPVQTESSPPPRDFVMALLAAMTQMAALSPRRQADVAIAMGRAGIAAAPGAVIAALEQLRRDGCIERPLHLSDGGILVSVTTRGIEMLAATAHRHVVTGLMTGAGR